MQSTEYLEQDSETQLLMKFKRDQFAVEIRKKKNADVINSKRMKFSRARESKLHDNLNPITKDDGDVNIHLQLSHIPAFQLDAATFR